MRPLAVSKPLQADLLYATPEYPLSNLGLAHYHKGEYETAEKYYRNPWRWTPSLQSPCAGSA